MERREHERLEHEKMREKKLLKATELKQNLKYYDPSQFLSIDEEQALGQGFLFNRGKE